MRSSYFVDSAPTNGSKLLEQVEVPRRPAGIEHIRVVESAEWVELVRADWRPGRRRGNDVRVGVENVGGVGYSTHAAKVDIGAGDDWRAKSQTS